MPTSKIITYDLRLSDKNYDALYEKIKSYGVWARICESVWFIKTSDSVVEVRDNLFSVLDTDDRLFVAELSGSAAWFNAMCENKYLQEHL